MSLVTVCESCNQECEVDMVDHVSQCCGSHFNVFDTEDVEEHGDYLYHLKKDEEL